MTNRRWLALPALFALIAYSPVLKLGFLVEDHAGIEANPFLRAWSVANVRHDIATDVMNQPNGHYYRPLLTLLNRARFSLWGVKPFGYRATGLALHAACAVVGALLIVELTGSLAVAVLAGCLFAVHPIGVHTQLVVMAQEEPLSLFFCLLALLWGRRAGSVAFGYMTLAYLCALAAKESAVVMPLLLALLLWQDGQLSKMYARLFVLIAATLPYLELRALATGPITLPMNAHLTQVLAFKVFPTLWWIYLKLLVWPVGLHYPCLLPAHAPLWPLTLIAWLALGAVSLWASRMAFVGWAWFTLWLAPHVPAVITLDAMMNHWAYPGAFAFFALIAFGMRWGWRHGARPGRLALGIFGAALAAGWTLCTWHTIADSATDIQFHARTLRYEPGLGYAEVNLGYALLQAGRPAAAQPYLADYVHDHPTDAQARQALAAANPS